MYYYYVFPIDYSLYYTNYKYITIIYQYITIIFFMSQKISMRPMRDERANRTYDMRRDTRTRDTRVIHGMS